MLGGVGFIRGSTLAATKDIQAATWVASPAAAATAAGMTFSRASTATYFNASGALAETATGVPRTTYNPSTLALQGILIEAAATNQVRNPRLEGAAVSTATTLAVITPVVAAGAITGYTITNPGAGYTTAPTARLATTTGTLPSNPTLTLTGGAVTGVTGGTGGSSLSGTTICCLHHGTYPTNFNFPANNTGSILLTDTVIQAIGTEDGVPYMDVRMIGSAPSQTSYDWSLDIGTLPSLATGQIWTHSLYTRLIANTGAITPTQRLITFESPGGNSGASFTSITNLNATSIVRGRLSQSHTLVSATPTTISPRWAFQATTGAFDFVVRVGGFQVEQNYFASSLQLPVALSPASTARAIDTLSLAGSAFTTVFGTAAQGTVVVDALAGQAASTGSNQNLFQVAISGDLNNRIFVGMAGGGLTVVGSNIIASVNTASASAGSVVVGTAFRAGLRWGAGATATCLNGGAIQTTAGVAPAGMNELYVGRSSSLTSVFNGAIIRVRCYPRAVSDSQFRRLTT